MDKPHIMSSEIVIIKLCGDDNFGIEVDVVSGVGTKLSENPSQFEVLCPGLDGSENSVSFKYLHPVDDVFNESFTDAFLCARAGKVSIVESPETLSGTYKLLRDLSDSEAFRMIPSSGGSITADDTNGTLIVSCTPEEGTLFCLERPVTPDCDKGFANGETETIDGECSQVGPSLVEESNSEGIDYQHYEEQNSVALSQASGDCESLPPQTNGTSEETNPSSRYPEISKEGLLFSTGKKYSNGDIVECLDESIINDDNYEQDFSASPTSVSTESLITDLQALVDRDLLTEEDNNELQSLLLMLSDKRSLQDDLKDFAESGGKVVEMGQMLGIQGDDGVSGDDISLPQGEVDSDHDISNLNEPFLPPSISSSKESLSDKTIDEESSSGDESRYYEDDVRNLLLTIQEEDPDNDGEPEEQTNMAIDNLVLIAKAEVSLPVNDANHEDDLLATVSENTYQSGSETSVKNQIAETHGDNSACPPSPSREDSFISCSTSIQNDISYTKEPQDNLSKESSKLDLETASYISQESGDDSEGTVSGERQPLLESSLIKKNVANGSSVNSTTRESIDKICLEIFPEEANNVTVIKKEEPLSIQNGHNVDTVTSSASRTRKPTGSSTVSFPLDSVSLTEDFFLKYADILDVYLSEAVDKFETYLFDHDDAIFELLEKYHALQPCQAAKDDTGLEDFFQSVLKDDLFPSLNNFKESLVLDAPDTKSDTRSQLIIPTNAFRKVRRNFDLNGIVTIIRNTFLDALKASKPVDVHSVAPMVIQNLDVRFSNPDVGHEMLCCVWKQTVSVFNYCKVGPLPWKSFPHLSYKPIDIVVEEMKKDLVFQVSELLSIDEPDHIQEVIKKPAFTACPAMFVLKQLQNLVNISLSDCRLQSDEALLLSIERIVCEGTADSQVALGRLLQELLLRIDSSLVVQTSGILPKLPITDKNQTTPLEIAIGTASENEGYRRSFSDLVIGCTESSTLNKPLVCELSKRFGFFNGISPLLLAAVTSGTDMLGKLKDHGATFESTDSNGNFFHNLVQMYHNLGSDSRYDVFRDRLLFAHHYVWEMEGVDSCKQLMQSRSERKLTPLELAIQLDSEPFFEAICNKLSVESSIGGINPITMYDVTDLDRGAYSVAATSPSGVNSVKSENSYFTLDLAMPSNSAAMAVHNNSLIQSLVESRLAGYMKYYYAWGVLHVIINILMTMCAVYRPINRTSFDEVLSGPGDKARLFGEIVVLMYALFLILTEMYDTFRFCNICAFVMSLYRGLKNFTRGTESFRSVCTNVCFSWNEAFHLFSVFRLLLFLFGWLTFFTFIFRLSPYSGEIYVLCPALIIGWFLTVFFFARYHYPLALINIGRRVASYIVVYIVFLIGFTSALFVSTQTTEEPPSYSETFVLLLRILATSDEINSTATDHTGLFVLINCMCLFVTAVVLISLLIASIVHEYCRITDRFDILSNRLMGEILLLVERRLPSSARKLEFLIKNGRAFYLVRGKPYLGDVERSFGEMQRREEADKGDEEECVMEDVFRDGVAPCPLLSRRQSKVLPATAVPLTLEPLMVSSPIDDATKDNTLYASVHRPVTVGSGELSPIEAQAALTQSDSQDSVVNV